MGREEGDGSAAGEGVEVAVGAGEAAGREEGDGSAVGEVGSPPPQAAKTASVSRSRGVVHKRFTGILYRISNGYRMPTQEIQCGGLGSSTVGSRGTVVHVRRRSGSRVKDAANCYSLDPCASDGSDSATLLTLRPRCFQPRTTRSSPTAALLTSSFRGTSGCIW